MRYEILKFLSDTYEFKSLNEFLKTLNEKNKLYPIRMQLHEMCVPTNDGNVIELSGDYHLLGQPFTELDGKSKTYGLVKAPDNPFDDKPIVVTSRGVGDLNNIQIQGRINSRGRRELEEYELKKSIIMVNSSVRVTNNRIVISAYLAAFLSLLSLIATLWKSDKPQSPTPQGSIIEQKKPEKEEKRQMQNPKTPDSVSGNRK